MKLSEYQNQIYKNNKNILELYEKNLVLKKAAAKSIKDKDEVTAKKLGAEIHQNSLKASGIEGSNITLATTLEQRRSVLDKKINDIIQKPLTKDSQKELSDVRGEIEAHSKLAAQHERERQKEAQAKKQKQEETYKSEKTKLYNSASNFIGDPVSLNNILTPLAQKKGTKESVGLGDMMSSGLSAFSFALKNAGSVIDVAGSTSFYKEEAAKIPMGKGVKEEASFFLKLLDDPDSVKFLQANSTKLGNLVETIAPTLISVGIRELSKLPELQERLVVHEKQHGLLTSLEAKLKKLQTNLTPNEIDNQQIAELTEQISNRKMLEQRISLAKTVEALEKAGITAEYIQKKLLPIAINPLKEILKSPQDVIEVANASLDIILEKDPKITQKSLQFIASKIDFGALIGSSGLQEFLVTDSANLVKIATIVMATNKKVKDQADKLGITPEIVQQVIPAVTQIASVALADSNKLTEVYKEMVASNTKLSDIARQEKVQKEIDRSSLSEEQIKELDARNEILKKQKSEILSKLIGLASKVVLQDNFLNSVRDNVSGLLDKNQAAITQMVTHRLGKMDEESLPRQILTNVSPEFAKNVTVAVTGLVSTVLKETSNEQIQSLAASGQSLLTASKEERAKVLQDLAGRGMAILGNSQVVDSLQNVSAVLVNSSADMSKIAVNAVANTAFKDLITPEQIKDSMPIVTKAVGAVLNSSQDIVTIATKSQELLSGLDKTTEGLTPKQAGSFGTIIESLSNIVNQPGITGALTKDLPEFLQKNKDNIPDIASNIVKNIPALEKMTKEMGVSDDLIKDAAKLGADLLIDAAPMVDKFARATLKEKDQLVTIISDVRDLTNAPKENQKAAVLKVVSNIIALKESNADLKNIFDKELPNLLEKNQEQLAKVIDGVIHTKAGPGLKLKTEKIIKIVADNLPAVTKLADLYTKGKYASMFPEIIKLVFKKDVLSTAIGTLSRITKHKAEKKKEDVENIVEETIKKDVDKEQSGHASQKKGSKTVSVGANEKTSANAGSKKTDLEHIKEKMDKHVSSSDRFSTIISKDKREKFMSKDKVK